MHTLYLKTDRRKLGYGLMPKFRVALFVDHGQRQYNALFALLLSKLWGCHGRDRIVIGLTTTCAISCEFELRSWQGVLDTTLYDKVCQ